MDNSEKSDSEKKEILSEIKKLIDHELDLKKREDFIKKGRLELDWEKRMYEMSRTRQNRRVNVQKALVKKYERKIIDLEEEHVSQTFKVEVNEEELLGLRKQLMDKEEELETLNAMNQALTAKERSANDQLQEVRQELIECLESNPGVIGVKRVGDIDELAFHDAIRGRLPVIRIREKAAELSSFWQDKVGNPNWHPFKTVLVEGSHDQHREILDLEDDNVKILKMHLGDEACEIVISALKEMNEYNPSGRFPVPELWNFEENRKATPREGVSHMDLLRKRLKRKC